MRFYYIQINQANINDRGQSISEPKNLMKYLFLMSLEAYIVINQEEPMLHANGNYLHQT